MIQYQSLLGTIMKYPSYLRDIIGEINVIDAEDWPCCRQYNIDLTTVVVTGQSKVAWRDILFVLLMMLKSQIILRVEHNLNAEIDYTQ